MKSEGEAHTGRSVLRAFDGGSLNRRRAAAVICLVPINLIFKLDRRCYVEGESIGEPQITMTQHENVLEFLVWT